MINYVFEIIIVDMYLSQIRKKTQTIDWRCHNTLKLHGMRRRNHKINGSQFGIQ